MYFYLTGIDHRSAAIDEREAIYRDRKAISDLMSGSDPDGSALLVTCNRIEAYGVAENADDASGRISVFFRNFPGFSKHAYVKLGEAQVFRHMVRLASGLESQLKGEPQISAQLDAWRSGGKLPYPIRVLLDRAVKLAREIRIGSGLNEDNGNIATLVFDDIERRLAGREGREIVIVGTGRIAELFAEYRPIGAHLVFAAHKNYDKARMLAKRSGGDAISLKEPAGIIAGSDALVCATSSPHHVINIYAISGRRSPLYIYDLAVPRGVDPAIGAMDGVYLYDLDSLEHVFERHNGSSKDRIKSASDLIEDELGAYQEVVYGKNY